MKTCLLSLLLCAVALPGAEPSAIRTRRFQSRTADEAIRWQQESREKLFQLMMGGAKPERVPLQPEILRRIEMPEGGYVLEELTLQSLPDRRAHVWMAVPQSPRGKTAAVLAINGHGGTGEEVVRGLSLYWYGRALAEMGYVVIAPDAGQHELQHANWTLMGERTGDALRCLDYLETRPEVDPARLAVAGLSPGGRLLDKARNEDGLWCNLVTASTGAVLNSSTPDTWGYALAAAHTLGTATGDAPLLDAVRHALRHIDQPRYLHWGDADAYADAIEGALLLLNRMPEREGFAWIDKMLPLFLGKQRDDGIVEGWYGDGNYARTALMAALYFTQGVTCRPWRPDLRFAAVRDGDTLHVSLTAEKDWQGTLHFDTPRHRTHLQLAVNCARLNEFPEWFTVDSAGHYALTGSAGNRRSDGGALASGLPAAVKTGEIFSLTITNQQP